MTLRVVHQYNVKITISYFQETEGNKFSFANERSIRFFISKKPRGLEKESDVIIQLKQWSIPVHFS